MIEANRTLPRWVSWAANQTSCMRRAIRANCAPYHHWPIIVERDVAYLPISAFLPPLSGNDNARWMK